MKIYFPKMENKYAFWFDAIFLNRYFTWKKILNYAKAERARIKRDVLVSHYPFAAYIDPTNICPLHCPLCPTGLRQKGRKDGFFNFQKTKQIIDEIGKYLFFIRFYNWGEPFLNKEIFRMVEYGNKNKIGSVISSNFASVNENIVRQISESSLDYLIVSADGVSQEVYEKYRKGGSVKKTLFYLNKAAKLKRAKKNKNLIIEWLYVLNKHNVPEVEQAIKTAEKIGVDVLHFSPICDSLSLARMDGAGEKSYSEFAQNTYLAPKNGKESPKTCGWLYNRIVFNWDGSVSPCCAIDEKKYDFADPDFKSVREVWNNKNYQNARNFFRAKKTKISKNDVFGATETQKPPVCAKCLFFRKK